MADNCERPKLSDFGLATNDSSVFYRTQWTRLPWVNYLFVLYRIVIALYMLGVLIAFTISQVSQTGGQYFLLLTVWALIALVVYLLVGAFIALLDGVIFSRSSNSEVMKIRHKIHWFLFNITATVNVLVTLIYWFFIYRPRDDVLFFFFDFNAHAVTTIISTLDLVLTAIPVQFLHFVYPIGFGIVYIAMTIIFWAAGGGKDYGPIYPFLDYTNDPGLAVGIILGAIALLVVLQGVLWCLYKLRVFVWMNYRNASQDSEALVAI